MVLFNYSTKELTAKIVYYGPGLCGKTTNLQWIHEKTPIKNKGKMLSLATEADRTLFFDFLPIELGQIRGMKTRIQLYTVPGQVFYNATRRMVLKGADCVVFVADSQEPMIDANLDSLANLKENLEANEINPDEIPMVVQFNKRDLPNALPVEILNDRLNPRSLPFFEAVAMKGQGVEETLKGATSLVFRHLASKYGDGSAAGASTSRPTPPAPARPPAPAPAPAPAGPGTVAAPPRPPTVSVPRAVAAAAASAPRPPAPPPPPRPAPPPPPPVVPDETHEEELSFDMSSEPGDVETISVDELALDEPAPPRPAAVPAPAPGGRSVPPAAKTTLVKGADETEDMRRRISRPLEPELTLDTLDEEDIEEISLEAPPAPARSDGPRRPATSTLPPVPPAAPARPAAPLPRPAAPAGAAARASTATAPPGSRAVVPSAPAPAGPAAARGPATNPGAPRFTGAAAATTTTTPPVNVTLRGGTPAEIAIPVEVKVQNGNANVEVHIRLTLNLKLIP